MEGTYFYHFAVLVCRICIASINAPWSCKDGRRLIGDKYVCDGRFHCTDGSDEDREMCLKWNCTQGYWKCSLNGIQCIPERHVCDSIGFSINPVSPGCRDGSDEDSEVCLTWQLQCTEGYWKCGSNKCIPVDKVCDGDGTCPDRSDEADNVCSSWQCTEGLWKCGSLECIPEEHVCDGNPFKWEPMCTDGSDETESTCSPWNCTLGYWKCGTHKCIPEEYVCDGNSHRWDPSCQDGSDEADEICASWLCADGFWKCKADQCIPTDKVCDSDPTCADESDEDPLMCREWNCSTDRWKCKDRLQCIKGRYVCNTRSDCNDESDESAELCSSWVCPSGTWRCYGHPLCSTTGSYGLYCSNAYAKGKHCPVGYHLCSDSVHCLEDKRWCDGRTFEVDSDSGCPDGSDEGVNCENWECLPDFWKCADNLKCIKPENVCDGQTSDDFYNYGCEDKSDEHNQLCGCSNENDWPCLDGDGCVSPKLVCDGYDSCNDGSDELPTTCEVWNCGIGMEKCLNKNVLMLLVVIVKLMNNAAKKKLSNCV